MADFVAGDETKLTLHLVGRDRARIDLTGGSATLRWRMNGGGYTDSSMTLVTPTQGVVRYQFGSSDLEEGTFTADVIATTSAGQTFRNRKLLRFEVRGQV